jgi:16S rRNA (cytidine1402-2'-O)-methyltransferase
MTKKGTLYLIPTNLSEGTATQVLPNDVIQQIFLLDEFIVENERSARRFLKSIGYPKSLDTLILHLLNEHTDRQSIAPYIEPLLQGKNVGLLSEAGCPCIADPGATVVEHLFQIKVKPFTGPSSILLALIASGMNGQNFCFNGYLPIKPDQRKNKIKDIERASSKSKQTQIFIETPYRNIQLLNDIIHFCNPNTRLCIACEITGNNEWIITKTLGEWKTKIPDINKKTVVFLLSA